MNHPFKRPDILHVLEDNLYHSERSLIDERAKAYQAKKVARQHDVAVSSLQDHIQELKLEIERQRALESANGMRD